MKILIVHNRYQQRGGEDVAREAETRLLRQAGHTVIEYVRCNSEFADPSFLSHLYLAAATVWSARACKDIRQLLFREKPDVAHFHNTFPLVSPSAYYACADAGVPVVQTLHNYRLHCPGANFLRDGQVCEKCLGRSVAWPAVVHACYRDNRPATAVASAMLAAHRALNTWRTKVNLYVALTEFARQKFIQGGLPADRILVKPNFVARDPGPKRTLGKYALYVGRLSEEKGVCVLLAAWRELREKISLKIAGDGPLSHEITRELQLSSPPQSIEWLGSVPQSQIPSLMHGACFLVHPSICFENFPVAVAEAFACGLPVIASRLGAMAEIVSNAVNGLLFSPGDPRDLAVKAQSAWAHPRETAAMGRRARAEFLAKYTAAAALTHLEAIYERALRPRLQTAASVSPLQSESRLFTPHHKEAD